MRTARASQAGFDGAHVELDDLGVGGLGLPGLGEHALLSAISLDQAHGILGPTGEPQVLDGFAIDGEEAAGGAVLGRHVGYGRAVGDRQGRHARAEELDQLADHAELAQDFGDRQNEIGGGHPFAKLARHPHADDLRNQERHGLPEHGGLGLDAAHAPAEHAKAVDHRRVRIRAHDGVGIGLKDAGPPRIGRREDHAREILDVDLVDDAGVGRHHGQIAECGLAPAQEGVALLVARKLDFVVAGQRAGVCVFVDLHRVVDDQLRGQEGIDAAWIAAHALGRRAHRGEIDDCGHAGEVLHEHPRRHERDLRRRFRLRLPARDGFDVRRRHVAAVFAAQEILEENFEGEGQRGDIQPGLC